MDSAVHSDSDATTGIETCAECLRVLRPGWSFVFSIKPHSTAVGVQEARSNLIKCLLCSLRHRPMLKKSLMACVVVGTLLTALNQGDLLLFGNWNSTLYWKIPLTYTVPFLVATYGALINTRK